jgi:hypothetical protein
MTDFDPDAYLTQGSDAHAAFDPDAYLHQPAQKFPESTAPGTTYDAKEFKRRVGRDPDAAELANFKAFKGEGFAGDPNQGKFTAGQAAVGGVEAGLSLASSVPASIAAAPAYMVGLTGIGGTDSASAARATRNALTYQPRTEAGQAAVDVIGQVRPGEIVPRLLDVSGHPQAADTVRDVTERVGDVAPLFGEAAAGFPATRAIGRSAARVVPSMVDPEAAPLSAQDVLTRAAQNSPQSMGAASAAPRMTQVSPELQQAVVNSARQNGGAVNPETLNRHIEADSLPVKIQLTPGQAAQDPEIISHEMNNRGKIPGLPQLLNDQNTKLGQNIQAIRDQVGPDVFSANHVEHGDTLIQAYKDKAAPVEADISQKYQALRDANGGQFPVSAPALLKNATAALNQELLLDHAPKAVMSTLGRLADDDNMTFQNFESLRTNLARIQRSSTDGNERHAAGVIRNTMEELPLKPGSAELKPLADAARGAARTQFQAVEADPAYKAALSGTVPPDNFVQNFVIGAPRDQVALMRQNLEGNDTATQTMGVATLDHLGKAAGVDKGTFSQANYNKHLQALSPKLGSLVDPATIEKLETLGNVARYTQAQPKGSFVNNSNTLVGALASHAAGAVEGIANVKAGGIPVGTIVRKAVENRGANKIAKETMTPYGGLTKLSDVGKP